MSHVSHTISVHLTWCGYTILPYQYSYRCPIILENTKESITKQCYRFLYYCSLIITSSAAIIFVAFSSSKEASIIVTMMSGKAVKSWKLLILKWLEKWSWQMPWGHMIHTFSPAVSSIFSLTQSYKGQKAKKRTREKGCLRARIGYTIKPWIVATPILLNSLYSTVIYSLSLEPDADKYETHSSLLNR